MSVNYLAVVVVAIIGFLLGWLWYSPVLFVKAWMEEMKFTPETMEACKPKMASLMAKGFLTTLLSTFGLAVLITAHGSENWIKGAAFGFFIGVMVVGLRQVNCNLWEGRSLKLQLITVGHEVALYTLQGAILGVWR